MASVRNLRPLREFVSRAMGKDATPWLKVADDGKSLSLHALKAEGNQAKIYLFAFLKLSAPLQESIAATNALAGKCTWDERGMHFAWHYHPEIGLNLTIQLSEGDPQETIPTDGCQICFTEQQADLTVCSACGCYLEPGVVMMVEKSRVARNVAAQKRAKASKATYAFMWTMFALLGLVLVIVSTTHY